jgi:hypothetical protein
MVFKIFGADTTATSASFAEVGSGGNDSGEPFSALEEQLGFRTRITTSSRENTENFLQERFNLTSADAKEYLDITEAGRKVELVRTILDKMRSARTELPEDGVFGQSFLEKGKTMGINLISVQRTESSDRAS